MKIEIYPNLDTLSRAAAKIFVEIGNQAVKQNGKFTVALAGGSTPKSLYRLLTTENFRNQIDWARVFFFFGDERNVLPDAEESNFRMANENLLQPLQISEKNVFRWRTEIGEAEKIAEDYGETIKEFFELKDKPSATAGGSDFPRFDLILLGMGADGHTASLFPFTDALRERQKIVVANRVEKLNADRLTLTFPAINNASNVIFLVKGADKAEILKTVLQGKYEPEKFPAQAVKLNDGEMFWLIDQSAAEFLR